jgi:WD40 repeat protein
VPVQLSVVAGHLGVIMNICWTLSGERFATVGADAKVLLWEPMQKTALLWLDRHSDVVENCTFIKDDYLVTSGRDKHFYVWDTKNAPVVTDPFATILDKRVSAVAAAACSCLRGPF